MIYGDRLRSADFAIKFDIDYFITMKTLQQILAPIFEEEQVVETPSGEKGHWVTTKSGKRIFIGEPALANKRLSTLDPSGEDRGRKITVVKVPQKDGTVKEVKKYEYSDKWARATARYKFAIANDIEKNRSLIEGALEKEIVKNGAGAPLATCALIIARTGMRVGQPGNATQNEKGEAEETYGATTLQRRHVSVSGDTVTFKFRGKSGVNQNIQVKDKMIAQGVKNILDSEGSDEDMLFHKTVVVKGKKQKSPLDREDVSERFKRFNEHYKPKDFRTAIAMQKAIEGVESITARKHVLPKKQSDLKKYAKELVKELGETVSGQLGNTPSVAISNYTNPFLVEYMLKQVGVSPDLLENMRNIATRVASSYDTPILVSLYGEDAVNVWFSSVAGTMVDAPEQDIEVLVESVRSISEKMADHASNGKWATLSVSDLKKDPALADEFIKMIQDTYKNIGGHAEFKDRASFFSGEDFIFQALDWDDDDEADIVAIDKTSPFGYKGIAFGSDGNPESKSKMLGQNASNLNKIGYYGEVSDALAHVMLTRYDVPVVTDEKIVRKVLKGKSIEWHGAHPQGKYPGKDGWYTRSIGGHPHMKIMIGRPKAISEALTARQLVFEALEWFSKDGYYWKGAWPGLIGGKAISTDVQSLSRMVSSLSTADVRGSGDVYDESGVKVGKIPGISAKYAASKGYKPMIGSGLSIVKGMFVVYMDGRVPVAVFGLSK